MARAPVFLRPLLRYADFEGRAHRVEFWSFYILIAIAYAVMCGGMFYLFYPIFSGQLTSVIRYVPKVVAASLAVLVISLALVVPCLALQVRRLHDSGRTGWWLVVPFAVTLLAQCFFYVLHAHDLAHASMQLQHRLQAMPPGAIDVITVWQDELAVYGVMLPWSLAPAVLAHLALLILFLWPGSKGPNRYGEDPRGRRERIWLFP